MRALVRLARRAWEDVRWLFAIVACVVLLLVLLPLVPVLRAYDDIRRAHEGG